MKTKKVSKNTSVKKPKKKVVGKVVSKKVSGKTSKKKKDLVFTSDEKSFWVSDGQILNSLVALRDALNKMEKEVFLYHVRKDRNDFSNWVGSVLLDMECANDIRKAKTPNSAKLVVIRHLKFYEV